MKLYQKRSVLLLTAAMLPVCFSLGHAASEAAEKITTSNPYYIRVDAGVAAKTTGKGTYYVGEGYYYDYHKVRKNAVTADVGFGRHVNDFFRTDVTLGYTPKYKYHARVTADGTHSSQDFSYTSMFANGYLDLVHYQKMTPYVMGGAGYGRAVSSNTVTCESGECFTFSSNKTNNFIWQVGTGIAYQWKENIAFDLGYRYANLGKVKTGKRFFLPNGAPEGMVPEYLKLRSHTVTVGMRFNFCL